MWGRQLLSGLRDANSVTGSRRCVSWGRFGRKARQAHSAVVDIAMRVQGRLKPLHDLGEGPFGNLLGGQKLVAPGLRQIARRSISLPREVGVATEQGLPSRHQVGRDLFFLTAGLGQAVGLERKLDDFPVLDRCVALRYAAAKIAGGPAVMNRHGVTVPQRDAARKRLGIGWCIRMCIKKRSVDDDLAPSDA